MMIDRDGHAHVIELNISDFGAFDREGYSAKDWMAGLERAARKISTVVKAIEMPVDPSEDGVARSIFDPSDAMLHRLVLLTMKNRYYRDNAEGEAVFDAAKFWRHHRKLIMEAYEAYEARRQMGEIQHVATAMEGLYHFAQEAGKTRISARILASLTTLALYEGDPLKKINRAED